MSVSIKALIKKLPIIDENVYEEAANMPMFFLDAARYRVRKMRAKYAAVVALEEFEASRGLAFRRKLDRAGRKYTEKYIKSKVLKDPAYKAMKEAVHEAEVNEEFSKLFLEVMRMRQNAIHVIHAKELYEGGKETAQIERLEQMRRLSKQARRLQAHRGR